MFAYCNNNPVNKYDSGGNSPISYCNGNGDRNPLFIGYYGCSWGGAGGGIYSNLGSRQDAKKILEREVKFWTDYALSTGDSDSAETIEIIQNSVAVFQIITGSKKMYDGFVIMLAPEPTLLAETAGTALILWGLNSVAVGFEELFD